METGEAAEVLGSLGGQVGAQSQEPRGLLSSLLGQRKGYAAGGEQGRLHNVPPGAPSTHRGSGETELSVLIAGG